MTDPPPAGALPPSLKLCRAGGRTGSSLIQDRTAEKELLSPHMCGEGGENRFGGKRLRQRDLGFSLTITQLGNRASAGEKWLVQFVQVPGNQQKIFFGAAGVFSSTSTHRTGG